MPQTPKQLIDAALAAIAEHVVLSEAPSPDSHTVVVAEGLDNPEIADALACYAVACLAGWVQRDATIADRFAVTGVDRMDEIDALVADIVVPPVGVSVLQEKNWMRTSRNAWIAEVLTHALFVVRKTTPSASLTGDVVALLRPHPVPKRQGLDSLAIYDEDSVAVIAIGETKATKSRASEELTNACDMFDSVDAGSFGPDLRNALELLADVMPADLAAQASEGLWRKHRCYVPAILHQDEFAADSNRARLETLIPPVARKRLLVLRFDRFDEFFECVADHMPLVVADLVI